MRLDFEDENGNEKMNRNDQVLTNDISEMSTVLQSNDRQQLWFQPLQDTWSLQLHPSELNASFPNELNAGGFAQWAVDPPERGHAESTFSAPAPKDPTSIVPLITDLHVERLSRASRDHVDQGDTTASSLASQSPASSRLSQEVHVGDLDSSFAKESLATNRLIQVYFAEIHPCWPILHAPTFDKSKVSGVLLGSMIMLASWLVGELDHTKLASPVFDAVTATLLV
jgi:Fungal specific transcription factor domain